VPDMSGTPRDQCLHDLEAAWRIATTGPGRLATAARNREALAQVLYATWWSAEELTGRRPAELGPDAPEVGHPLSGPVPAPEPPRSRSALTAALQAALSPEPDWWVIAEQHGLLWLGRCDGDGRPLTRTATEDDVLDSSRPGTSPRAGDRVVTVPGTVDADAHWWRWRTASPAARPAALERWYLDLSFHGALRVVPLLAEYLIRAPELRAAAKQRALKCPAHPQAFARRDSVVVYLADDDPAREGLSDLCARLSSLTREGHQPLTTVRAPGVSQAQDPGNGRSFGEIRCRTVASAVLDVLDSLDGLDQQDGLDGPHHQGGTPDDGPAPVRALADRLGASGVDLDVPGMCGIWEIAGPVSSHRGRGRTGGCGAGTTTTGTVAAGATTAPTAPPGATTPRTTTPEARTAAP